MAADELGQDAARLGEADLWLTWDVSRTAGSGGLRLHWTERQGWYYALIGMSPQHVLLCTVLLPFRSFFPPPQEVADLAGHLLRTMRVPDVEYRTEWDGAWEVRAATRDFRRAVFGLASVDDKPEAGTESARRDGVQLTIDTQADTFERAIAGGEGRVRAQRPCPSG
ncbi:DUF6292 family protein [Streptomyces chartreusis]|uniref:DUF6292 family protein n=1 Tax=Streptomyces chartreusis TaxID=1969 RepID=UPI0038174550